MTTPQIEVDLGDVTIDVTTEEPIVEITTAGISVPGAKGDTGPAGQDGSLDGDGLNIVVTSPEFEQAVDQRIADAVPTTYAELQQGTGSPTGTSPTHAFPYPVPEDDLRVQEAIRLLTEALDSVVTRVLVGTDPPPEPAADYPEGTVYMRVEA